MGNNSFSVEKVIQVLSYLQEKSKIKNYQILIKYVFFADRYLIRKFATPLLDEPKYYAMKQGPVASITLDIITKDKSHLYDISQDELNLIDNYIDTKGYEATIKRIENYDLLSKADIEALEFVLNNFTGFDRETIIKITHQYPEWTKFNRGFINPRTRYAMSFDDFFMNPGNIERKEIFKILGAEDPFLTFGQNPEELSLAREAFQNC